MKNIKNAIAAAALAVIFGIGSQAHAGLLVSDFGGSDNEQPCVETNTETTDWGILLADLMGGIFGTNDNDDNVNVDCGILMAD